MPIYALKKRRFSGNLKMIRNLRVNQFYYEKKIILKK